MSRPRPATHNSHPSRLAHSSQPAAKYGGVGEHQGAVMRAGWEIKNLSSVSAINYGYTESASSDPVGPRFLRITDIQDDRVDWGNGLRPEVPVNILVMKS
jgi:hypothetical protein